MMRGARLLVPVIAVAETLIWIFAVGNAMQNMNSAWHMIGYAGGFAAGTMAGMWLEERLAYGYAMATVISRNKDRTPALAELLRKSGYGVTQLEGRGKDGPVYLFLSAVRRGDIPDLTAKASNVDSDAVIMVEETRALTRGWLAPRGKK